MKIKERVIAAINLKTVDKIPTSFRASNYLSESLMRYFGIEQPEDFGKNYKTLLGKMGADFWSSGSKIDKFSTFIPKFNGPLPELPYIDDGTMFYTIGIRSKMGNMPKYDIKYPNVGIDPPLAAIDSPLELKKGFLTSKLDLFDFNQMQSKYNLGEIDIKDAEYISNNLICMGTLSNLFMICCYLRGMENFLMDMAFNKSLAEHIVGEVGEFCLEFNKRELSVFGDQADYYGTWDDVAGQNGMMFSPEIFKKYFLPLYKQMISNVKKYKLFFGWHCCGSIHDIMPCMIDAGIDVFDVVQTSARDMNLENIYKLYGKSVCIHGGMDIQKLLVESTKKEIEEEVKKVINLWGDRGGVILAPSHETLPDTPIENILTIYEVINNHFA